MNRVKQIKYFDAHAMLGKPCLPPRGGCLEVGALAQHARDYHITKSLVYSAVARDNDPNAGNDEILEITGKRPDLVPCWVALPHHTGECLPPAAFVRKMKEKRVRAVRIFPEAYGLDLSLLYFEELLSELAVHKVPVFVEWGQHPSSCAWENLCRACGAFKALPVILSGGQLTPYLRQIACLLERCPNLMIETAGFQVFRGMEYLCKKYGAHRMLFSTRRPYFNPFPAVTAIAYAMIGDRDKTRIASGNLAGLLEGVAF